MAKKKVCIIIPIYKERLNKFEQLSIRLVKQKLALYDTYFITYHTLDMRGYREFSNIKVNFFPKKYFKNALSYNRLLLNPHFYRCFEDYTYMLIVQTDALVLGEADQLEKFMAMHYDYWGARWREPVEICAWDILEKTKKKIMAKCPKVIRRCLTISPQMCYVGNGGLSLRNIDRTIALLDEKRMQAWCWLDNEDKFFAYYGLKNSVGYRIAPSDQVDEFSLEGMIKQKLGEVDPFGVHGWEKAGKLKVTDYLRNKGIFYHKTDEPER